MVRKSDGGMIVCQEDFTKLLSKRMKCTDEVAREWVRVMKGLLIQCMLEGIDVHIKDLGNLEVKPRKGYKRYNKMIDTETVIPDRNVVYFKASARLNKRINGFIVDEEEEEEEE